MVMVKTKLLIFIALVLTLLLSSCSSADYYQRYVPTNPPRYEYRCIDNECRKVNVGLKAKIISKEQYNNLSKDEQMQYTRKNRNIENIIYPTTLVGMMGGGVAGGIKYGVAAGVISFFVVPSVITGLFLATFYMLPCKEKDKDMRFINCPSYRATPEEIEEIDRRLQENSPAVKNKPGIGGVYGKN
jgi:hypothetical protein